VKRRAFIAGLGSVVAWPMAARGQQPERMRRIGVLMWLDENDPGAKSDLSAFTQALAGMGWTEGRNVRMDLRWHGDDPNRIRALAHELVGLQPDIILASGSAITAVQRETRTIPIVFAGVDDPSPMARSRGSTARAGTSLASRCWKLHWEASGLSCSRRSCPGSSASRSCSIPTTSPRPPTDF
jgi:ABC-type uncharacterized transport system substrate-binding protein